MKGRRITVNTPEIKRIIRQYYEKQYFITFHSLDKMKQKSQKNVNYQNEHKKIWKIIVDLSKDSKLLSLPHKKNLGPGDFIDEFCTIFKEKIVSIFHKYFLKIVVRRNTSVLIYKANIILIPKKAKTSQEMITTDQHPLALHSHGRQRVKRDTVQPPSTQRGHVP